MATYSSILAGESQGQRSLVGCHLWGRTESDTTEVTWQQQQQSCNYVTSSSFMLLLSQIISFIQCVPINKDL